ncbi:TIGR00270 family protein [Candidatus Woesearchaeota archaeon]|nr:TIGR00270 family protein [Candidatus Woesearchaeota archaeon]
MDCELCGKPATKKALVEGVNLNVCNACVKLGQEVRAPLVPVKKTVSAEPLIVQAIVPDPGTRIKQAREKFGLTQKDFAIKINEHQSVIHKLETGHLDLTLDLARKLEKALHIKLIEERQDVTLSAPKTNNGPVTIGDLIRLK